MSSLAEAYPEQQARCRVLMLQYKEIGENGMFGLMGIESVLQRADEAAARQDVVEMLRSFEEMKLCK